MPNMMVMFGEIISRMCSQMWLKKGPLTC